MGDKSSKGSDALAPKASIKIGGISDIKVEMKVDDNGDQRYLWFTNAATRKVIAAKAVPEFGRGVARSPRDSPRVLPSYRRSTPARMACGRGSRSRADAGHGPLVNRRWRCKLTATRARGCATSRGWVGRRYGGSTSVSAPVLRAIYLTIIILNYN